MTEEGYSGLARSLGSRRLGMVDVFGAGQHRIGEVAGTHRSSLSYIEISEKVQKSL